MSKRLMLWMVGLVIMAAGIAPCPGAALAQPPMPNLLVNGGLETPYYAQGRPTATAPNGWTLWVGAGQPEALPHADRPQIHEGKAAWTLRSPGAPFTAAGVQRVTGLTPGMAVQASAYAWLITCADAAGGCTIAEVPYHRSDSRANAQVRIGIDPAGGTDPTAPGVIWSETAAPYDQWGALSVTATASGEAITVFLYMTQETGLAVNTVFWDDVSLVQAEGAALAATATTPAETARPASPSSPTPTQPPTATPSPTSTGTPTHTPAPTDTPPPTDTPTPDVTPIPVVPVAGLPIPTLAEASEYAAAQLAADKGTLCVTVYQDETNYGTFDPGEDLLPGAQLSITPAEGGSDGEPLVLTYDGRTDPLCTDLPGGVYGLHITPPTGYGLTSPQMVTLTLINGRTVSLKVGSALGYVLPEVPVTHTPVQTVIAADGRTAPTAGDEEAKEEDERSLLETLYRTSGFIVLGLAGIFVVGSVTLAVLVRRGDLPWMQPPRPGR